jgi:hypothetical protein
MPYLFEACVHCSIFYRGLSAIALAAGFGKLTMHVQHPVGACAFVQIVHVLRAKEITVADLLFQFGQREMRGVRLRLIAVSAPFRVEGPHQPWIAFPRIRRAHIFNSIPRPQSVIRAKRRQPAFRADASTC